MNKSDCVDKDTKYTRKSVKSKVQKSSRRTNLNRQYVKHEQEKSYQTDSRCVTKRTTTGDTCDRKGKGSKRRHGDNNNYVEDGPGCSKCRKDPEPEAVAMSAVAATPVVAATPSVVLEIPVGVARPMIRGLPVSHAPRSISFNVRVNSFPNRVEREADPPVARVESMYVVKVVVKPLGVNAPGRNPDADDEMSS